MLRSNTFFVLRNDHLHFLYTFQIKSSFMIKSILIHEYQRKSKRINTSQHESNTSQHGSKRVQHESTPVRHESTRINTSPKQFQIRLLKISKQLNHEALLFNKGIYLKKRWVIISFIYFQERSNVKLIPDTQGPLTPDKKKLI